MAAWSACTETISPVALGSAAILFLAGSITSFLYVGSVGALVGTAYGRVLLAKVAGFAIVVMIGYFNWQRVRPRLELETTGDDAAAGIAVERLLMRSACLEVAVTTAVLAFTAALVVMPLPMG